ncbi:bifunctional 4-hydroxy-2-oxoglutarate aldolase/2-dehydro-3-deoxy-phosphogluconate aldolase [Actinomadura sp. HBU206391]|uniref:bifunctional 4-hydroxy-2-oxoglutarate aldolase/2-dehydro-3-deoxy-phosphogluconate aldolase n=1 Tax=Actinomadura sp. HBU206391 TaxID=2731692 RepID=UPI00164FBED2|nr:bifunctional 4-hydroxy-2-oxoglutarate aldolase/2-dehydro-3-deoxy-phosphogluconate aldolase [Actinomadura sp. HBU206391]MBC6460621.1 bifunctional 4-hydroxy-2-oxoglutarate aldolase/2-dehydro-3-deoxy-phosphogluconate aldolase [Actinomadura sp. HBU206391]
MSGRTQGATSGETAGQTDGEMSSAEMSSGMSSGMSDETYDRTGGEAGGDTASALRVVGAVAILRLTDHRLIVEVGRALHDAGLTAMEITFDHPAAPDALSELRSALPATALLGAGTIRTPEQVELAASCGARYCVSPHTDPALIRSVLAAGLEPLPGAGTATEVATAQDSGARLIKLFPAGAMGLSYLRALLGPFRGTSIVPTGGIRHEEVGEWLAAGAAAVGLGSDLVPAAPAAADLPGIAARAARVAAQIKAVRAPGGGTAP